MDVKDFDDLLQIIGLGRWNFIYYSGMSVAFFIMPCYVFASSFLTPATPYSCDVPMWLNETEITMIDDSCSYTYWNDSSLSNTTEKCSSWSYNQSEAIESLTSEFDLICDQVYLRPTYQSAQMVGTWTGALINGYLSDRYGRTRVLKITITLVFLLTFVSSFLENFKAILIFRLLIGLCSSSIFQIGFILCMEITPPKQRSFVGIIIALPWAFGMMWWGTLGYFIRDWRWLQLASEAPFILVLMILWFTPESPRWLIVQGEHKKALKSIKVAARYNKKVLPDDLEMIEALQCMHENSFASVESFHHREGKCANYSYKVKLVLIEIFKLFRTPEVRRRTLLMMIIFVISSTVYIGLSLNAVNFDLDPYMYMIVGGIMEIPAYTIIAPIISKYGRTRPIACFYFMSGATIISLGFIPTDYKWLVLPLAMLGRFANAAGFQIVFLIASEIFPTEVRIQAMGTFSFVSTISVASPYIIELVGAVYPWIPSVIFSILSFLGAVTVLFVPESLNIHLPETISQLERETKANKQRKNIYKGEEADLQKLTRK